MLQCQGFKLNEGEEERPSLPPAALTPGIISGAGTQLTLLISGPASPAAFCNLPASPGSTAKLMSRGKR